MRFVFYKYFYLFLINLIYRKLTLFMYSRIIVKVKSIHNFELFVQSFVHSCIACSKMIHWKINILQYYNFSVIRLFYCLFSIHNLIKHHCHYINYLRWLNELILYKLRRFVLKRVKIDNNQYVFKYWCMKNRTISKKISDIFQYKMIFIIYAEFYKFYKIFDVSKII